MNMVQAKMIAVKYWERKGICTISAEWDEGAGADRDTFRMTIEAKNIRDYRCNSGMGLVVSDVDNAGQADEVREEVMVRFYDRAVEITNGGAGVALDADFIAAANEVEEF